MDKIGSLRAICQLRALQLYYHYCHNLTKGPSFNADHELFKSFYESADSEYDRMVEYHIAAFGSLESDTVTKQVAVLLDGLSVEQMSTDEMFANGLKMEYDLYQDLTSIEEGSPIGFRNLLGDISESSDVRQYKIKQRLS